MPLDLESWMGSYASGVLITLLSWRTREYDPFKIWVGSQPCDISWSTACWIEYTPWPRGFNMITLQRLVANPSTLYSGIVYCRKGVILHTSQVIYQYSIHGSSSGGARKERKGWVIMKLYKRPHEQLHKAKLGQLIWIRRRILYHIQ